MCPGHLTLLLANGSRTVWRSKADLEYIRCWGHPPTSHRSYVLWIINILLSSKRYTRTRSKFEALIVTFLQPNHTRFPVWPPLATPDLKLTGNRTHSSTTDLPGQQACPMIWTLPHRPFTDSETHGHVCELPSPLAWPFNGRYFDPHVMSAAAALDLNIRVTSYVQIKDTLTYIDFRSDGLFQYHASLNADALPALKALTSSTPVRVSRVYFIS